MSDLDLQIASIALTWETPLVSLNQEHYRRLIELAELNLEDWLG